MQHLTYRALDGPVTLSLTARRSVTAGLDALLARLHSSLPILQPGPDHHGCAVDVLLVSAMAPPPRPERPASCPRPTVVMTPQPDIADEQRWLTSGVRAVLPLGSSAASVARAAEAALEGRVTISQALVARPTADCAALSDTERQWMMALSAGRSVADLASDTGYSERHLRRLLKATYRKLGAGNRAGAIAAFVNRSRPGLLDPSL